MGKVQRQWGSFTSEELHEYIEENNPVVLLPVGSYEQHGPHLPLDTDTHLGQAIAEKAVAESSYPSLLLPSLWVGASLHHMGFCGTVTLSHATLAAVVRDIITSLKSHGVEKVLVLNSHGGNQAALLSLIEEINVADNLEVILVTYWHLIAAEVAANRRSPKGGISHACELETSLKLYLKPLDVRTNRLKRNLIPGSNYCTPEMFASNRVSYPRSFQRVTPAGHIGDPTVADADFGKLVFETAVRELSGVICAFGEGSLC